MFVDIYKQKIVKDMKEKLFNLDKEDDLERELERQNQLL